MQIMGILNVTPDSFSDGGQHFSVDDALFQAEKMVNDGADIIDIGGESTRPFAEPVSAEVELERVIPVITKLRQRHQVTISVDTTKASVAKAALVAGADIINDISALQHDSEMLSLVKSTKVPVIIMHMQGTPEDMQINPQYHDVVREVYDFFTDKLGWLEAKGVDLRRIILDPGIGFGKTKEHNLSLLKHLSQLRKIGQPLLLGHSRKRFIGEITGLLPEERDGATAIISALAISQGVDIVRVHNVRTSRLAIKVAEAVQCAP